MGKKYKKAMTDEAIRREAIASRDKVAKFVGELRDKAHYTQEEVDQMLAHLQIAQHALSEVEHLARKGYAIFKRKQAQVTIMVPSGAIPLNEFQKMVKGQQAADPAVKAAKKAVDADYALMKEVMAHADDLGRHMAHAANAFGILPN